MGYQTPKAKVTEPDPFLDLVNFEQLKRDKDFDPFTPRVGYRHGFPGGSYGRV